MGMLGSVNTGGFSEASKAAMMNSDYFNRPTGIARFAGGFADMLTGNRFDFDKRGENDDDDKEGMFDKFLEGNSYRPDKRSDTDQLLAMASQRAGGLGMGGGTFQDIGGGNVLFSPSNAARNQAIAMQNQQNMIAAQQRKEQKSNVGRMAGAAIGNAIVPGVGGVVGGLLGGLFCDIRLKEDIAPLCKSEVNDVLSECAFFVKDLNECS